MRHRAAGDGASRHELPLRVVARAGACGRPGGPRPLLPPRRQSRLSGRPLQAAALLRARVGAHPRPHGDRCDGEPRASARSASTCEACGLGEWRSTDAVRTGAAGDRAHRSPGRADPRGGTVPRDGAIRREAGPGHRSGRKHGGMAAYERWRGGRGRAAGCADVVPVQRHADRQGHLPGRPHDPPRPARRVERKAHRDPDSREPPHRHLARVEPDGDLPGDGGDRHVPVAARSRRGVPSWTAVDPTVGSAPEVRKTGRIVRFFERKFGPYPFDSLGGIIDRPGCRLRARDPDSAPLPVGADGAGSSPTSWPTSGSATRSRRTLARHLAQRGLRHLRRVAVAIAQRRSEPRRHVQGVTTQRPRASPGLGPSARGRRVRSTCSRHRSTCAAR